MLTTYSIEHGPSKEEIKNAQFEREGGIRRLTFHTEDKGVHLSVAIEGSIVLPGTTDIWTLSGEATLVMDGTLGLRREAVITYNVKTRKGTVVFTSFIRAHPEEQKPRQHPHRVRHPARFPRRKKPRH